MRDERNSKRITWTRTSVGYRVMADGKRSYCYRFRDADGIQRCSFLGKPISKVTHYDIAAFIRDLKGSEEQEREAAEGKDDLRSGERSLRLPELPDDLLRRMPASPLSHRSDCPPCPSLGGKTLATTGPNSGGHVSCPRNRLRLALGLVELLAHFRLFPVERCSNSRGFPCRVGDTGASHARAVTSAGVICVSRRRRRLQWERTYAM